MDLIPSFAVDHTKIVPGIFESRVDVVGDAYVTTFDIRVKRPNVEKAVSDAAMHTIEHVIATYLRNDAEWKDKLVYWGPMGCLTGFYMIVKGRPASSELYGIILDAFRYMRDYEGEVPGATAENCGNYLLHDLKTAKEEAAIYVDYLEKADKSKIFEYPHTERLQLDKDRTFFDS